MGKFRVEVKKTAQKDLKKHYRSGNKATIRKIENIFKELEDHPRTGTGKPEKLKHEMEGQWSRRINHKDRLIYSIDNDKVIVYVLSAMGHYDDH